MEIIGFVFLCGLNLMFSAAVIINFLFGGGDLGALLTGWVSWSTKAWGLVIACVNVYFWYLLYLYSPIGIVIK